MSGDTFGDFAAGALLAIAYGVLAMLLMAGLLALNTPPAPPVQAPCACTCETP